MARKQLSIEDRKSMSFREAEGAIDLPSQLQWGEVDQELRMRFWDILYSYFDSQIYYGTGSSKFKDGAFAILLTIYRFHGKHPLDDAEANARKISVSKKFIKTQLLTSDWDVCLDLVQTVLRHRACPRGLKESLVSVLNSSRSPYLVVDDPPTIIPKGSPEEGETVVKDLQAIKESGLAGSRSHLISAVEALNSGDNRGAIREAIHAVESASKIVSGKPHATLPDCLKVLENERDLHPALKKAFDSLYGYTSIEKGIRHALLEGDNEKVGTDEALFMFSACTAFVSYLARKFPEQS